MAASISMRGVSGKTSTLEGRARGVPRHRLRPPLAHFPSPAISRTGPLSGSKLWIGAR
jgi:hypothetical protein